MDLGPLISNPRVVIPLVLFAAFLLGEWLAPFRVSERSKLVTRSIRDMELGRTLGVIVMAIRKGDGQMVFNPPADTAVFGGDYLIVMGRQENLRTLETLLA